MSLRYPTLTLIIFALLFNFNAFAQTQTSANTAIVDVLVTNLEKEPKPNQIIIFENTTTHKIVEGTSDENGKLSLTLPVKQNYSIQIQGISEAEDYMELKIPAPKSATSTLRFNINIEFEPPMLFTLHNVHFQSGSADLKESSFEELQKLLDYLTLNNTITVEIAGHTDDVGESIANVSLSQKRAEAVRQYVVDKGIDPKRVSAKGYGEHYPVSPNNTPEGRQKNRRTEVRILE